MRNIAFILQFIGVIAIAPLISGLITKIKNNLRMRRGQSVFQPYYNLIKLFNKAEVIPEHASWIFRLTPFIALAASLSALMLMPLVFNFGNSGVSFMGEAFTLIFIFSIGRFFTALAGLDTASAFGGMGASREMFVSGLAEPAAFLAIFAVALRPASTAISTLGVAGGATFTSLLFSAGAFFMIALAETSRIPVDNQETHLELTMIHEAMALEYSGKRLAFIELSSYIKQVIWFTFMGHILLPALAPFDAGFKGIITAIVLYMAKLLVIGLLVAALEVSLAKMRLLRAVDYFGFSFVLGLSAVISALAGF